MVKNEYWLTVRLSVSDKEGSDDISGLPNRQEMAEIVGTVIRLELPPLLTHYAGRLTDQVVEVKEIVVNETLSTAPPAPQAVLDALAHVRRFLPDVDRVTFTPELKWEYSIDGEAPEGWPDGISTELLEDAADAVDGPAVFFVVE